MHLMVYGEVIQSPQVRYAAKLTQHLPENLSSVYFTNSGAEATEGAMKLAKRVTGRSKFIHFKNSYHGSTQGALSVMGDEYWRNAYRPLLPGVQHAVYNSHEVLSWITTNTACVVAETIQAEAGVNLPQQDWLTSLRDRCNEMGTLLILDENQCGFGRNGSLWAFQQYNIVPDILVLGKALGGGMPLGGFIANKQLMDAFTDNPVLGHITTFGGHPVCCAAGKAAMTVLLEEQLIDQVKVKEQLFLSLLQHPKIKTIRSRGLMMAVELEDAATLQRVIQRCIENGVFVDWFLFAPHCIRIAPPLNISEEEIREACGVILQVLDQWG
jgi:acetylornithine/succinyldiaminopimelate/putrescine aminotransferase